MKVKKIVRNADVVPTYDISTTSGAYSMPNNCVSHNSSLCINSTNGINLAKQRIIIKSSKAGEFVQVVPEYRKLKKYYQLLWDQRDCIDYIKTVAVLQAYVDQAISSDTFYNPAYFPEGKIPATLIAKNLMLAHKWGLKSHYYSLTSKEGAKTVINAPVPAVIEQDPEFCEACVL